jgi:hypothetical protein
VLVLVEAHNLIHMFASSDQDGGAIYYKTSPMDQPSFAPGQGTPVIRFPSSNKINNAATTDQNVDSTSGIVVVATDQYDRLYFHAYIPITKGLTRAMQRQHLTED